LPTGVLGRAALQARSSPNKASVTSAPKTTGRLLAKRLTSIFPYTVYRSFVRRRNNTPRTGRTIRVVHSTLGFPEKSRNLMPDAY
jgi:hypothetical protein